MNGGCDSVLAALVGRILAAGAYNAQDQAAPSAILWTDRERQWEPLVQRLRASLPQIVTLGALAPASRQGPAIWLRCMVQRMLPEAAWPAEAVPIIYLPGVSRHELRAVDECPRELQPLAELQYRGVWFTQDNTKDWTVSSFLASSRGGLGLDIAPSDATREAVLQSLTKLADTPVSELRGRRLHAADFQALLQPDLVKQLLRWLDAPKATRDSWSVEEWQSFRAACVERYSLDPEKDGEITGAEKLGSREGSWDLAWQRFAEAPSAFPGLPDLLRRAKPKKDAPPLFFHRECWPQCNEADEVVVRDALMRLADATPETAVAEIERLESAHGERRAWVWARLGEAPMAAALQHLAALARSTRTKLTGDDAGAMATAYAEGAWRVDGAALDALAVGSKTADSNAIRAAVQAIYKPWLEDAAERFQDRVGEGTAPPYGAGSAGVTDVEARTCVLFADGLRLDLGKRLRASLEAGGCIVEENWRFVPMPPVTPTAKPAASPVADLVCGAGADGVQFMPVVRETGQPLTIDRFRKLLTERGFQVLKGEDTGDPMGRAWAEYGTIDQRGHEEGWKLARRVEEEISGLAERVTSLLDAGWREIRVVTDHGWVLLPSDLPKVEMPQYLVESRWSRCGTVKPGALVDHPTVPWHWNSDVQVVIAPGIGSFWAGNGYSHGSLSVQECVVPNLIIRRATPTGLSASFTSVRWTGLRCRVQIAGAETGWRVDLRTKAADPATSLAKDGEGVDVELERETALVVEDPDHEGAAATLVLVNAEGRVVAKHATSVGGEA